MIQKTTYFYSKNQWFPLQNQIFVDGKTKYKGVELTTGVYYYILDVFNVIHNQKESYSGNVTIFNDE